MGPFRARQCPAAGGGHDGRVLRGHRNTRRRQDPEKAESLVTTSQASSDEWMQERLAAWAGRRLSQFRVSEASLILDFWELDDDYTAWLYADELQVTASGVAPVQPRRRTGREAIVALHALLGREVAAAEVAGGALRLAFAEGGEVIVAPAPDEQAWALTFEQGGSVTCEPGGVLDVRPG